MCVNPNPNPNPNPVQERSPPSTRTARKTDKSDSRSPAQCNNCSKSITSRPAVTRAARTTPFELHVQQGPRHLSTLSAFALLPPFTRADRKTDKSDSRSPAQYERQKNGQVQIDLTRTVRIRKKTAKSETLAPAQWNERKRKTGDVSDLLVQSEQIFES